jgi:long-chain-fatty-acid--CoA ligase ACSBG
LGGDDYYPRLWWLAQKLVFSKVRAALGFDRCRSLYSSAAPISPDTLKFFGVLNLPVVEVFGMSECTGPQTTCWVGYNKCGSVGVSLPGCELQIDHVDGRDKPAEGEICFRGRHIMMGYMNDAKKTQEAIDPQGWLHSGDVGRVDEHGLLYITGRIKELIITAGGENIAPVPVEESIKSKLPALSNVIMIGDRRKYNVMLVTVKCGVDLNTGLPKDELVGDALQVSEVKTVSAAKKCPKWRAYIQNGLDKYNKESVSNAQKVQKFDIVSEFAIPTGELTPTLKLKRAVVHEKYKDLIDGFYANDTE